MISMRSTAVMLYGGGALIGIGIACALATGARWRVILSGPLAALCAVLVAAATLGLLATGFAVAAAAWWARRIWQLRVTDALRPPNLRAAVESREHQWPP